jgi:hypothetical protein
MKETLKQKLKIWNGKTWFGFLGYMALATILYIFFVCVTADRKPRCFYLQAYGTGVGVVYQIMVDIDWTADPVAFVSSDYKLTMETFEGLPQCGRE